MKLANEPKVQSGIAGSEGSGGNVNTEPSEPFAAPVPRETLNESDTDATPDDTLGSHDISGSALPDGGTLTRPKSPNGTSRLE